MGTFLRKLFERYARRMLAHKVSPSAAEEGIVTIAANKRVKLWAENLYADFKKAGVPDEVIQTENDIKVFHHKIAEMNNQNITRQFESMMTPKKSADVLDLSGKKIPPGSQIMGGEEVIVDVVGDTVTQMKAMTPMDAMAEANSVIGRKGKYKNLTKEQSKKILKDTEDHIFERDIKYDEFGEIIKPDPEDFAGGGRTGYDNGKFVSDPTEKSPKNFYNLGIGPDLGKFMSEGVPRDEKGFHTTLNKEDLKYMWEVLQGKHPIKDIEDELMFRFGRVNPEKKSEFFAEIGKDKGGIGWKKKFAGGGRTSTGLNYLLGEDDQNSRVPFGLGGMGRRAFLKLMGAGAATGVAAKSGLFSLLKAGKPTAQVLTSVPIKNIEGMPVWFKPLVNKVIKEGDDVTKKFATVDREIVHKSTLPDSKTDVLVTQDLTTGNVTVDLGLTKHGFADGKFGQPVRLEYKAGEVLEGPIKKGKPTKTKDEFWVEEAEFTGGHPENVKFEDSTFNKFGKHESDFSEVEAFSKGKTKKVRLKQIESSQKEAEDLADHFSNYPKPDDFSSGGRVPLAGGKGVMSLIELIIKKFGKDTAKRASQLGKPQKTLDREMFQNFNKKLNPGKDSKSIIPKDEYREYKNDFNKEILNMSPEDQLRDEFPGISDRLIRQILTDKNPQRIAEVKQTMREALKMQEKGMGHEEIIEMFKKTPRTKNASGGRVPLADGKKVSDPGYFMFQEPDEDRPSRYEYDASTPEKMERVRKRMEEAKKELIRRGLLERKSFSEKDTMPTENYFLEAMQNPEVYFPKNTPEELENIKRNLRLKQQVKDGGRVPLSSGLAGMLGE